MQSDIIKKSLILRDEEINQFELFSFDVFDTLVTRATATPVGIFLLIEKELQKTNIFWLKLILTV